jgi:hypothetical protein
MGYQVDGGDISISGTVAKKADIIYVWDFYPWRPAGFDWGTHLKNLRVAKDIWVPSESVQLRLRELGLDSFIIKTGVDVYDIETSDGGYVLDPVRYYPLPQKTWVEEACAELGIPCIHSEHQYTQNEFRNLIANCTFMTCAFEEASTGGLSLMEGLWNGKVSLVSDSQYMGARDYIGEMGYYFKWDSYEDLKTKIKELWQSRPAQTKERARAYMQEFTQTAMANRIHNRLCELLKK